MDNDFFLFGSFGLFDCYFQVTSEHLRRIFFESWKGKLGGELPLILILAVKSLGCELLGRGGGVLKRGILFAFSYDFATHLLVSLLLVDVDFVTSDLVLKLLCVFQD